MRTLFYSGLLALAFVLTGCASYETCDLRGPNDLCEIHHAMMQAELISNSKQPPPTQEYLEARVKSFVHAKPFYLPDQCQKAVVNICPDCERGEAAWKNQHPGGK